MNPLSIRLRNFRSYDELELDLPQGVTAIVGENGAGKSSLLTGLELALFGGPLGRYLTRGGTDTELLAELTFEHRGDLYRARRSYSGRGKGQTKLDLEQVIGLRGSESVEPHPDWVPLTAETASATQQLLEQTLGISRETFRASSFLAQGDGAAFTEAQPRERKAILAEVLGLDLWDRLLELARTDRGAAEKELASVLARVELNEQQLETKLTVVAERASHQVAKDEAAEKVAWCDAQLADLNEELAQARERQAALAAARELCDQRQDTLRECGALIERLSVEHDDLVFELERKPALQELADTLPRLEQELRTGQAQHHRHVVHAREHDNLQREVARIEQESNRLLERSDDLDMDYGLAKDQIARLEAEEHPSCPTCGQEIAGQAKERTLAELREKPAAIEAEMKQLHDEWESLKQPLAEAKNAAAAALEAIPTELPDVATIEEAIRDAGDAVTRLAVLAEKEARLGIVDKELKQAWENRPALAVARDAAVQTYQELEEDTVDVDAIAREFGEGQVALERFRARLVECERGIARCDERLEILSNIERQHETDVAERVRLHNELAVLVALEKAYSRDGIPALIIENAAIPQIETEANRILQELATGYQVELRTQRALKSTEGVREALDIVVNAPDGEGAYEDLSGGERTRVNLALRIALARLLAHRRGAEVKLLAIDEPDGLDQDGFERLAAVLRDLQSEFDKIVVISHQAALKEAFDSVLEVVGGGKTGEPSRIVGHDREPVAA